MDYVCSSFSYRGSRRSLSLSNTDFIIGPCCQPFSSVVDTVDAAIPNPSTHCLSASVFFYLFTIALLLN